MKKQSRLSRFHESLGARHPGPHKQSIVSRTKESKAMSAEEHKKHADHHHKMMKHHMDHMHKAHKKYHITPHDRAVDRRNLEK